MKKIKIGSFGVWSVGELVAMFIGCLAFVGLLWALLSLSLLVGGAI